MFANGISNSKDSAEECIQSAERPGRNVGILTIKSANDWIAEAINLPNPRSFFKGLFFENENTVLFASTNVGKSILAVQIGVDIAQTDMVCYIDLELSKKQFQLRYTNTDTGEVYVLPPNFHRAEINQEKIGGGDLEQEIIDSIEEEAINGTKFFIIDNITFLCHDAEKSKEASEFMMKLIRLKKKYGLTTIVIAHTPKRHGDEPITHNDLAGSAKLISFFDAGIALARSGKDEQLRYLKQVKVRSGEYLYDSDNVMVLDLIKSDAFLHFEVREYATEAEHLKNGRPTDSMDEILVILRLKKSGKSLREIAKICHISLGKVQRRLKKAEDENITLPEDGRNGGPPEPTVSTVSEDDRLIQPIQPIHSDAELPLCYEEN